MCTNIYSNLEGSVSTIAGSGLAARVDGVASVASFNKPQGLGVDSFGKIFVTENGFNKVRQISSGGEFEHNSQFCAR